MKANDRSGNKFETDEVLDKCFEDLKTAGKYEVFMKFMKLVANNVFPLNNIAFLLFMDNVEWFSEDNLAM